MKFLKVVPVGSIVFELSHPLPIKATVLLTRMLSALRSGQPWRPSSAPPARSLLGHTPFQRPPSPLALDVPCPVSSPSWLFPLWWHASLSSFPIKMRSNLECLKMPLFSSPSIDSLTACSQRSLRISKALLCGLAATLWPFSFSLQAIRTLFSPPSGPWRCPLLCFHPLEPFQTKPYDLQS